MTCALLSRYSTRQHRPEFRVLQLATWRRHRLLLAANAAAGPAT
jgi:hypothetical protein